MHISPATRPVRFLTPETITEMRYTSNTYYISRIILLHTLLWWVILPRFANWYTYLRLSTNQIDRILIILVTKPHVVIMISRHCSMFKAFIHVVRVALLQMVMTSLAKQFTDPQSLWRHLPNNLWIRSLSIMKLILQILYIPDPSAIVIKKRP